MVVGDKRSPCVWVVFKILQNCRLSLQKNHTECLNVPLVTVWTIVLEKVMAVLGVQYRVISSQSATESYSEPDEFSPCPRRLLYS